MHFVKAVKYLSDYKLQLMFETNIIKQVDLKNYLDGEIFEPLLNIDYFKIWAVKLYQE